MCGTVILLTASNLGSMAIPPEKKSKRQTECVERGTLTPAFGFLQLTFKLSTFDSRRFRWLASKQKTLSITGRWAGARDAPAWRPEAAFTRPDREGLT